MSYCIMSCRNANLPTVGLELFGGGGGRVIGCDGSRHQVILGEWDIFVICVFEVYENKVVLGSRSSRAFLRPVIPGALSLPGECEFVRL